MAFCEALATRRSVRSGGLRLLAATLLVLAHAGCAFGPRVERLGPDRYAALNERAAREPARLVMRDGTKAGARSLVLGDGTATWIDAETGRQSSAPLADIAEVRLRNTSGRGAAIGGGWGFLTGALVGALAGLAAGGDSGEECDQMLSACMSAPGKALLFGLTTGTLGWVVGVPIGMGAGADDVYRIPPPHGLADPSPGKRSAGP